MLQSCGSIDDGYVRGSSAEAGQRQGFADRCNTGIELCKLAIQVPDCASDAFLLAAGKLSKRQSGAIQAYAKRAGIEIAAADWYYDAAIEILLLLWPTASYAKIDGAGRMSPLTHAEAVNEVVDRFISRSTGSISTLPDD